jgi:DNA-binding CsgD family transcriptional regulator
MREANVSVDESGFDAMGIENLIAHGREAGIQEFEELSCHGTGGVVQITVDEPYNESQLSELDCVDEWNYIAETERGHCYVIAVTAPGLPEHMAETAAELVGTCEAELGDRGATLSLVGPQETISETIRSYEAAGVSTDLRRLGAYEGRSHPTDSLTDRQQEVIQTAFDMGYYDVPRAASTETVADEIGLDGSTVAEHLQRAERNLLSQLLD